mgnify:CR=1 FL=1
MLKTYISRVLLNESNTSFEVIRRIIQKFSGDFEMLNPDIYYEITIENHITPIVHIEKTMAFTDKYCYDKAFQKELNTSIISLQQPMSDTLLLFVPDSLRIYLDSEFRNSEAILTTVADAQKIKQKNVIRALQLSDTVDEFIQMLRL